MFFTTKSGYDRLNKTLNLAINSFNTVCKSNAEAASGGDNSVWHDNFAYEQNQKDMQMWSKRVSELKKILANIKIVDIPENPDKVQLGCIVTFQDKNRKQKWTYEVAGYDDGDIKKKRISYNSPLMQKFINKEISEEIELFLEGKNRIVTITTIMSIKEKK